MITSDNQRKFIASLLLFLMLGTAGAFASAFMPPITYYGSDSYRAEAQNWSCTQDADGLIYIGNNAGLLRFDGYHWALTKMPGESVVRSVLAIDRRIYVGSFEEFGYFEADIYGRLQYTSLTSLLPGYSFSNEDIWCIKRCGSRIFFQSFGRLFEYDGREVHVHKHESLNPLYFFVEGGNIYVQAINDGLYKIVDDTWVQIISNRDVPSHIVAMKRIDSERYLAFSEHDGVFVGDKSGRVRPWRTDIDDKLRKGVINRVAFGSDGMMYVGTLQSGLFALDADGHLKWNYSADNGLENNSVLGVYVDATQHLWAMLDDGLALIHTCAPFEIMIPDRFEPHVGMVYSTGMLTPDKMLIASNQGLYTYSLLSGAIAEVPDMSGQGWQITTMDDGSTFVSGNVTTLCIRPDGRREVLPTNSTYIRHCTIHGREALIQTSYHTVRVFLRDKNGVWKYSNDVQGFGAPIRQVEVDASGALWCSHLSRGLYRVELDPSLQRIAKAEYFTNIAEGAGGVCYVIKVRGTVLIANNIGLFQFDERTRRFVRFTELDDCLPSTDDICSVTPIDDSRFWVASRSSYDMVEYDGETYHNRLNINLDMLNRKNNGANNNVDVAENGMCYFTFNNGVGRCSISQVARKQSPPQIKPIEATYLDNEGCRINLSLDADSVRPVAVGGNISLKFAMPDYGHMAHRFHFELRRGDNVIDNYSDEPEITYANLRYGDYEVTATALDDNSTPLTASVFSFSVPRSDWWSWWALLLYGLALGLLVLVASQLYNRRQMRMRRIAYDAQKAEQDLVVHQQELIIAEQQKKLLESELTTKGKELAALAMSAYSKQQVIDSMKESLADQRSKGGSGYQVASALMKKIESADTGSREFWSVFEMNFDLIHQHFFRNLKASYPSLSPNDMKFCALLRLNLATKDIARFANISVRGVETARYRLRRKFNLQPGESLVEFLLSFKGDGDVPPEPSEGR